MQWKRQLLFCVTHASFYHKFFFFLSFFLSYPDLYVPTHGRCRGLLSRLITLNDTHTHTHTHTYTHTNTQSVWLLWARDRPVPEISTPRMRQTPILPEKMEPPNPASDRTAADTRLRLLSHERFTQATVLFAAALPPTSSYNRLGGGSICECNVAQENLQKGILSK